MEKVIARAKINLALQILGRRPDGYHELALIFQPVSLCDVLWIEEKDTEGFDFSCSVSELQGRDNLVCRGYEVMKAQFGDRIGGLSVHLDKKIPSGAGMGGGSADCAALLVWMNRQYELGLDRQQLCRLGAALGADVPACMIPHATVGRGIGEVLRDIAIKQEYPILVIQPPVTCNTAEMFHRWDRTKEQSEAGKKKETGKKTDKETDKETGAA